MLLEFDMQWGIICFRFDIDRHHAERRHSKLQTSLPVDSRTIQSDFYWFPNNTLPQTRSSWQNLCLTEMHLMSSFQAMFGQSWFYRLVQWQSYICHVLDTALVEYTLPVWYNIYHPSKTFYRSQKYAIPDQPWLTMRDVQLWEEANKLMFPYQMTKSWVWKIYSHSRSR